MRAGTFRGGHRFQWFAGQPEDTLVSLAVPPMVCIPIRRGSRPSVKPGDMVHAGQIIAIGDDTVSPPVLSSISGQVLEIGKAVIIKGDGNDGYKRLDGYSPRWEELSSSGIEGLVYESGAAAVGNAGIPVEDLIVHAACSDVYNPSLKILLGGRGASRLVDGLRILQRVMPGARAHLAISDDEKSMIAKIDALTFGLDKFEICSVVPKYPQELPEMLVRTLLNRKLPRGRRAADIGVMVLDVQDVLHVFEAVAEGKPVIERIVALCGPCFKERTHVRVRIGTPLEFILKGRMTDRPARIVLNSLLTGSAVRDPSFPVDRTVSQIIAVPENTGREILAFMRPGAKRDSYSRAFLSSLIGIKKNADTNLHGEERPCIQCGYCVSACPVRILPGLLTAMTRSGDSDLTRYGILDCIGCNLCSYVCPSKIPLSRTLRDARVTFAEVEA